MKKKLFVIPFIILSFVLIFVGCAKTPKPGTNTESFQYYYESPSANVPDEGIAVDGSIGDEKWQGSSWMSFTRGGVTVKATSFFGEEGLYVAMDVDCKGVYYAADFMNQYNSLCELNVTAAENTGKTWTNAYRTSLVATAKYSMASTSPVRHAAKATVKGEINTQNSNGMVAEFYIPWNQLKLDGKPDKIKLYPTYKRTYSAVIASSRSMWIAPGRVSVPSTYYEFDSDGYLESDPVGAVMGMSADGMEKTGGWTYDHENGKYTVVENDNQWLFFKDAKATNYHIKATMDIDGGIDDGGSRAGLMMGYDAEKDTFAALLLSTSNSSLSANRVTLNKLNATTTTWQLSSDAFYNTTGAYDLSQPVTLQVYKVDDKVWILINDDVVYSGIVDEVKGAVTPGLYSVACGLEYSDCEFTSYDSNEDALYESLAQYTNVILTGATEGGSVEAAPAYVADGENAMLTFVSEEGYVLKSVTVNGDDVTDAVLSQINGGKISTAAIPALAGGITDNVRVVAEFEQVETKTVSGKFTANNGGSFTEPVDVEIIGCGDTANAYYRASVGADGSFTFKLPAGEYRILASVDYYNYAFDNTYTVSTDLSDLTLRFEKVLSAVAANASPLIGGVPMYGSQSFMYGEGYAYSTKPGNHNSYLENSVGTVQMVSADISLITSPSDPDPSVGFNFDNSGDATKEGFNVLLYKNGIRSSVIGSFASTNVSIGDLGSPVSVLDSVGTPVNLTVVRDNTTYYAFVNGKFVFKREADYVEGEAAVSLMTGGCTARFANIQLSTDEAAIRSEWLSKANPVVFVDEASEPDVEYKANASVTVGETVLTGNTVVFENADGSVETPAPYGHNDTLLLRSIISNTVSDAHKITLTVEYARSTKDYDPSAGVVFLDENNDGAAVLYWQNGIRTFDLNNYGNTASSVQLGFDRFVTFDGDKNVIAHGKETFTVAHYEDRIYVFTEDGRMLVSDTTRTGETSAIALLTSGASAKFTVHEISTNKTAIAAFINNAVAPGEGMTAVNGSVVVGAGANAFVAEGNVAFGYNNAENATVGSVTAKRGQVLYSVIDAPAAESQMLTFTVKKVVDGEDADPTAGLVFIDETGDRTLVAAWREGVRTYRVSNPNGAYGGVMNGGAMLGNFRADAEIKLTVVRTGNEIRIFDKNDILISRYAAEDYLEGKAAVGFMYIGCVAEFSDYTVTADATAINAYLSAHDHDNALATVSYSVEALDETQYLVSGNHPYAYGTDGTDYWYESVAINGYTRLNSIGVLEGSLGKNQMASATLTYLGKENKDATGPDADPSMGFVFMDSDSMTDGMSLTWIQKGIRMETWKNDARFNANKTSIGLPHIDGDDDATLGKITTGASINMTVVRKGSYFYVFVDDVLVNKCTLDRFAGANAVVALISNGCYARFTNYEITTAEAAIDAYVAANVPADIDATVTVNGASVSGNTIVGKTEDGFRLGAVGKANVQFNILGNSVTTDGYQLIKFNVTKPVTVDAGANTDTAPGIGVVYKDGTASSDTFFNLWYSNKIRSYLWSDYTNTMKEAVPGTAGFPANYHEGTAEQSLIFARKGNDYYVYRLDGEKYSLVGYRRFDGISAEAAMGVFSIGAVAEVIDVEVIVGKNAVNNYLKDKAAFELDGTNATVTMAVGGAGDHEVLVLPASYGTTQMVKATVKNTDNTNDAYPSYGVSFVNNQRAWLEGLTIVRYDDGFRTKINGKAFVTHTAFDLTYVKDKATETITVIRKDNTLYAFVNDVLYFVYDATATTTAEAAISLYSGGCKTEWTNISYTAVATEVDAYLAQYGAKTTNGANGTPTVGGTKFTSNGDPWKVGTNGAGKTYVESNKRGSAAQTWMHLDNSVSTAQVITVTIEKSDYSSTRGTDAGATVGVVFSNRSDARYGAAILLGAADSNKNRIQFRVNNAPDGSGAWSNSLYYRNFPGVHSAGSPESSAITLTVARINNTYYIFINGQHVVTEEEYSLNLGEAAVGFIGYGASAQFSDWSLITGEAEVKAYLEGKGTDGYFVNSYYRNEADSADYSGNSFWKYTEDADGYYVTAEDTNANNNITLLDGSEGTNAMVEVTLDFVAAGTKGSSTDIEGDPAGGVVFFNESKNNVAIVRVNNNVRFMQFKDQVWQNTYEVVNRSLFTDFGVATEADQTFVIIRKGNEYYAFVGDELFGQYTSSMVLGKAAAGLMAINSKVNFRNFSVTTDEAAIDAYLAANYDANVNATVTVGDKTFKGNRAFAVDKDGEGNVTAIKGGEAGSGGRTSYNFFGSGVTTDGYQLVKFNVTKPTANADLLNSADAHPAIGAIVSEDGTNAKSFLMLWLDQMYRTYRLDDFTATHIDAQPETNTFAKPYLTNDAEQSLVFARKGNDYYIYRLVDGKYTLQYYRHFEELGNNAAIGLVTVGATMSVSGVEVIAGKSAVEAYLKNNAIFELDGTSATVTAAVGGAGDHEVLVLPASYGATQMISATVKNTDNTNDADPSFGYAFVNSQKAFFENYAVLRRKDGGRFVTKGAYNDFAFGQKLVTEKTAEKLTVVRKDGKVWVYVNDILSYEYSFAAIGDASIALYSGGCKTEWSNIAYTAVETEVDAYMTANAPKTTNGANGTPTVGGTTFKAYNQPWYVGTNGAGKTYAESVTEKAQNWMFLDNSVSTAQAITVTISDSDYTDSTGTDAGSTVGVVFSNKSDARYGAAILLNAADSSKNRMQFRVNNAPDGSGAWSNALYYRNFPGVHSAGSPETAAITLTVARINNTYYIFINGEHIFTEEEYPLDLGEAAVGFIGYGASAQFSDWSLITGETEVKAYLEGMGTDGYFVNSYYRNEADSANYQGSRLWKYTEDGDNYYVSSADTDINNDTTYLNGSEGTQAAVTVTLDFVEAGTIGNGTNVEGDPLAGVIFENEKGQSVVMGRLNNGIRVLEFGSGTLNKITGWVTGAPMSADYGVATNAEERITFVRNGNDFFVFTSDGRMYLNYTASFDLGKAAAGFIAISNVTNFKNYEVVTGNAVEDIIDSHTNGSDVFVNATGLVGTQVLGASTPFLYNEDGSIQNAAAGNHYTYLAGSKGTVQMVSADVQLLGLTAGEMDASHGFAFSKVTSARNVSGAYAVLMKRDGIRFAASDGTTAVTKKSGWTVAPSGGTRVEHTSGLVSVTTYTNVITDASITSGTTKTTVSADGKTATRITYDANGERTQTNVVKDVTVKFMAIRKDTNVYAFVHNGTDYVLVGAASYDNLTGDAMIALWTGGAKVKYSNLTFSTNATEVQALLDRYNAPAVVANAVTANTNSFYSKTVYFYNADGSAQNDTAGRYWSSLGSVATKQLVRVSVSLVDNYNGTTKVDGDPSMGIAFALDNAIEGANSWVVCAWQNGIRMACINKWSSTDAGNKRSEVKNVFSETVLNTKTSNNYLTYIVVRNNDSYQVYLPGSATPVAERTGVTVANGDACLYLYSMGCKVKTKDIYVATGDAVDTFLADPVAYFNAVDGANA